MKLKIFSVYDSKVCAYDRPVYCERPAEAKLSINEAAKNPDSTFYKYPGDYTLFEIGTFDDSNGAIVMHDVHINHGTILSICSEFRTPNLEDLLNMQAEQAEKGV